HPLGFFLLGGEEADDVLGQAGRQRIGFDVRDEAGLVTAAEPVQDFDVAFLGHGRSYAVASVAGIARRVLMEVGDNMSASETPRRASITTSLMRRQLARTPQEDSMPQAPAWTLHSVMPSGPSMASTISMSEISRASRARR